MMEHVAHQRCILTRRLERDAESVKVPELDLRLKGSLHIDTANPGGHQRLEMVTDETVSTADVYELQLIVGWSEGCELSGDLFGHVVGLGDAPSAKVALPGARNRQPTDVGVG